MIGHEARLSQTNSYGWVPTCECGWIGDVVPLLKSKRDKSNRNGRSRELTKSIALTRHGQHLLDVRADIARRSDAELARIGKMSELANATLQHRGRYGHP